MLSDVDSLNTGAGRIPQISYSVSMACELRLYMTLKNLQKETGYSMGVKVFLYLLS